ncbi:MAG: SHOCT domain-containing protein [Chloroflexi bacterium]|nr:SHOCT domain-containing protein [Chloroflexota bacterium]
MMTGFGMGFSGIGLFVMVLFWIGLIAGAVWLVKTLSGSQGAPSTVQTRTIDAREILNQRYARGDISREEYDHMKNDLL